MAYFFNLMSKIPNPYRMERKQLSSCWCLIVLFERIYMGKNLNSFLLLQTNTKNNKNHFFIIC
jgi:hypothetical protein